MAKYRKTTETEISEMWHPQIPGLLADLGVRPRELQIDSERSRRCRECGFPLMYHGEVNTLEGVHIVCPGDRIATGVKGEHYPIKPDIFEATYEPADTPALNDKTFIEHIQAHLEPGCDVICKICGKTAREICEARAKEVKGQNESP